MSLNIGNPNNDISTSAGTPPSLGGQSPLVADNATVSANSSGNVSRWVMSTAAGGVGVENGANTWAKIATFTGDGISTSRTINKLIFESATVQTDKCYAEVVVNIYDSSLSTYGSIDVLNIIGSGLAHNSFKLVKTTAGLGNPVELWVQKTTTDRKFSVIESPIEDINTNTAVAYNDGAAWQSTTPTGAVNITSDWAGSGPLTSTSLSNSTGTVYYEKSDDGLVTVDFELDTLTTTTDATTYFTMPSGFRHGITGLTIDSILSGVITGGSAGALRMTDTGVVSIYNYAASTGNWRASFRYRARA